MVGSFYFLLHNLHIVLLHFVHILTALQGRHLKTVQYKIAMSSSMYPRAVKICLMQDALKMHRTSKMPEHPEQESLLLLDPPLNKFEIMLEEPVS
jgi:hypothetical protein